MKYHTTALTILISIAIVLLFTALAVSSALYLDINSPGEAIITALTEGIENSSDFSFSFSSLERQMSRKIVVSGLELKYKGETIAGADYLSLDMTPLRLLLSLIFRSGSLSLELGHPVVSLDPSSFSSGAGFDLDELNSFLQNLESHDLSSSVLSRYSYVLNVVDMDVYIGSFISFEGADASIRINKGVVFDSFAFYVNEFKSDLNSFEIHGGALSFSGRKAEDYMLALSADFLNLSASGFNCFMRSSALMISFPSFSLLDIRSLPLIFSLESAEADYSGLSFAIGYTVGEVKDGSAKLALSSLDLEYSPLSLYFPNLDFVLSYDGEFSAKLFSDGDFYLTLPGGSVFTGIGLSLQAPNLAEATLSLTLDYLYSDLPSADALSLVFLNDFSLAAGRSGLDNYTLDGYFSAGSRSPIELLDDFSASFSYFVNFSAGEIDFAAAELNGVSLSGAAEPIAASLDYGGGLFEASVNYSNEALFSASYDGTWSLNALLESFRLERVKSVFDFFAPAFGGYISSDTSLSGTLSYAGENSRVTTSLDLNNIAFGVSSFDSSLFLDVCYDSDANDLIIESATVSAFGLKADFSGSLDLDSFFPEGQLSLSRISSGSTWLSLDFQQTSAAEYFFIATGPSSDVFSFTGTVNWERFELVFAEGVVDVISAEYPFDFMLRRDEKNFDLMAPGIILSAGYENGLDLLLTLDNFTLPSRVSNTPMTLDGRLSFLLDLERQIIEAEIPSIELSNITFLENRPSLSLSLLYKDRDLFIEDILLSDGGIFPDLSGRAVYDSNEGKFALTLGDNEERINSGFTNEEDGVSGILEVSGLRLDRFGAENAVIDLILAGWGGSGDFSVSGSLLASPAEEALREFSLAADLLINSDSFALENVSYKAGSMEIISPSIAFNSNEGAFGGDIFFSYDKVNLDAVRPVKASLSFVLDIGRGETLFQTLTFIPEMLEEGISGSLTLSHFDMDNGFLAARNKSSALSITGDKLTFAGDLLDGFYEYRGGNLDLKLDLGEIGGFRADGFLNFDNFDLSVHDIRYDLSMINILSPEPMVTFSKGSIVRGNAKLFGSFSDFHIYAQAFTEETEVYVFYVDRQYIRVGDFQASMVDNHAISSRTPVLLIDKESGEIQQAFATLEVQLSPSNILDYFDVFLEAEGDNRVHIRIPLVEENLQLSGDVVGDFTVHGDTTKINLSGDLRAEDAVFSIGMDELPEWAKHQTNMFVRNNYSVTLGSNCSFVMPLGPNPIISASFAENTSFTFLNDSQTNEIDFTGDLIFRSGEIYYFEKSFYITSGNLSFDNNEQGALDPRITLNARLRDFDSRGEKLDIFLILNNSSLFSLNPYFDSSPKRDVTEIMEILGAAILPTSAYGSSLTSVASLVSSGVEVLGRTGYLSGMGTSSSGISNVIRSSLGLDIFSLRTSLFRNFLIDTIFTDDLSSYSPVARYLNDTAIYFGKYITQNLFLQGMVHLEASRRSVSTFIANDLDIDFEISLEWQTPLGQITFATSPSAFTLYNLFDSFSLSYSNRIQF